MAKHKPTEMTVREYIGDEQAKVLHDRIDQLLDSKDGFAFIATPKPEGGLKVTDVYKDICGNCVAESVGSVMHDAQHHGLLAVPAGC